VNAQTFAHLPWSWSILYHLARLDRKTFLDLVQEGVIHPRFTLQEARDLVAKCKGKSVANNSRLNVKQRLQRFADFVRGTANDWRPQERQWAEGLLAELIEQLHSWGDGASADDCCDGLKVADSSASNRSLPIASSYLDSTNDCLKTLPLSIYSWLS
jgi:hypothetical protein